jgi:hypothetical protein
MSIMKPVHATSYSRGFTYKPVKIVGIANGVASCDDSSGNLHDVPTSLSRAKGAPPQVGERWIICQDLGVWTFFAILNYAPNRGIATILNGHTSVNVTFANPEPDSSYGVQLTPTWSTAVWYTGWSTTGFVIHCGTAPGADSPVTWNLVR